MSGLPTSQVLLDNGAGTFPYDITAYVRSTSLSFGRGDEASTIEPSQLDLELDNNTGRFTFGSATYGIFLNQRVRLIETVGATTSTRFTGYVQNWPTTWENETGIESRMSVTAVDRLSRFARRTLPASLAAEQLVDGPAFQYALGEASGATAFGDTSGNQGRPLSVVGTGSAPVPGFDLGLDQTAVTFALGERLGGSTPVVVGELEAAFAASSLGGLSGNLVELDAGAGAFLILYVDAFEHIAVAAQNGTNLQISGSASVLDGLPHVASASWVGTSVSVSLDGVVVASSGAGPSAPAAWATIDVGAHWAGRIFGVAGYGAALSPTRRLAHFAALGFTATGESSDARLTRLAGYAGLTGSDLALEAGVLTNTAQQAVAGTSLLESMRAVETAEGGTLFVRGDGKLVQQNRTHRMTTATGTAALALVNGDVEHSGLTINVDDQYLKNMVTVTRVGGATQSVVNAASVALYDAYPEDLADLLVTTDDQALDRASWEASNYGTVSPRMSSVTVDLLSSSQAVQRAFLALVLGDRITVAGLPSQSPVATADLLVEGFREERTTESWTVTFNTVPAALFQAWKLEDPVFGSIDNPANRIYY